MKTVIEAQRSTRQAEPREGIKRKRKTLEPGVHLHLALS